MFRIHKNQCGVSGHYFHILSLIKEDAIKHQLKTHLINLNQI